MNINGLEINSPEYWELRHRREDWPRISSWALDILVDIIPDEACVLEVGCGQGAAAIYLAQQRPDLYIKGFDIAPTAIERANEKKVKNTEFIVADVFDLKRNLAGEYYDYAFSIQNFEHWKPERHVDALRQIWSRIRPGGRFFFTGVGRGWSLDVNNFSPMLWRGEVIQTPNDLHYNNWSEQDFYDLCMKQPIQAETVKFWRLRKNNRVIAEAQKQKEQQ